MVRGVQALARLIATAQAIARAIATARTRALRR
jgi:hypothetical protein